MTTPNKAEVCKNPNCDKGVLHVYSPSTGIHSDVPCDWCGGTKRSFIEHANLPDGTCGACATTPAKPESGETETAECVCAETGFRNCPVHQNEPPQASREIVRNQRLSSLP